MSPTPDQFRAAADPATPAQTLSELAQHPELQSTIASNPSTYAELLEWLRQYGDATVQAALDARERGESAPAAQVPAPPAPPAPAYAASPTYAATPTAAPAGAYVPAYAPTYATAASGSRFVEPGRAVPIRWSTYPTRYLLAVIGASLAGLLSIVLPLVSFALIQQIYMSGYSESDYATAQFVGFLFAVLPSLAMTAAVIMLPAPRTRTIVAVVLAGAPIVLQLISLLLSLAHAPYFLYPVLAALGALAGPAAVAAWFTARMRPGVAYAVLAIAIIPIALAVLRTLSGYYGDDVLISVISVAVLVGIAWLGRAIAASKAKTSSPVAYAGAVPTPVTHVAPVARTNTLAILALVFGIGGGWLGILFGHMALSQIKRTGEQGRGLALAGLICGYAGIVVWIVVILITISVATQTPYYY